MGIAGVLSFFIRTSDFAAEAEAKLNVLIFFNVLLIAKDCKFLELASLWHNNLARQKSVIYAAKKQTTTTSSNSGKRSFWRLNLQVLVS